MFWKITITIVGVLYVVSALPSAIGTDLKDQKTQNQEKTGQKPSPINIKANIIPKSEAHEDAKNWTTGSAIRLMYLINQSNETSALKQSLKKVFSSSVDKSSSEFKFRGMEDQDVLEIDNHMRANLPSSSINLKKLVNLLLPSNVEEWLSSSGSMKSALEGVMDGIKEEADGLKLFDYGDYLDELTKGFSLTNLFNPLDDSNGTKHKPVDLSKLMKVLTNIFKMFQ